MFLLKEDYFYKHINKVFCKIGCLCNRLVYGESKSCLHIKINIDSGNEPQFLGWPKNKSPNLPKPDFLTYAVIIVFNYLIKRCQTLINAHNGLEICD